jgi:hypothetical protein
MQAATPPEPELPVLAKFEVCCPDFKRHIFNCAMDTQLDVFTQTQKEIADYVGRTYKNGGPDGNYESS